MAKRQIKSFNEQLVDMGIKPVTFGEMLKMIREDAGLSQSELSAKMKKLSKSHISDIENDRRSVSVERVAEFSKALKYPLELLMSYYFDDELQKANLSDKYTVKIELKKTA